MSNSYDDADDWANEDETFPAGFWEDLPRPLTWRVIVLPIKAREVSKGGIVIPVSVQETQQHINSTSKLIAMGWMAGAHERLGGNGEKPHPGFPKVGDYVEHGKYAGQQIRYKGRKLLMLNDDELLAVVPNPSTTFKSCV